MWLPSKLKTKDQAESVSSKITADFSDIIISTFRTSDICKDNYRTEKISWTISGFESFWLLERWISKVKYSKNMSTKLQQTASMSLRWFCLSKTLKVQQQFKHCFYTFKYKCIKLTRKLFLLTTLIIENWLYIDDKHYKVFYSMGG